MAEKETTFFAREVEGRLRPVAPALAGRLGRFLRDRETDRLVRCRTFPKDDDRVTSAAKAPRAAKRLFCAFLANVK